MSSHGPGNGRARSAEDLAEEIMNQPGEGLDDLLEASEVDDDGFYDEGLDSFEDSYDDSGSDDFSDF